MKLIIIDMDNNFWRNCYKVDVKFLGYHIGGIFGSIRSIIALRREFPDYFMACVWDSKGGSKRRVEMMKQAVEEGLVESGYKENRKDRELDEKFMQMLDQKKKTTKFFESTGICSIKKKGWEADDIIGKLAKDNSKGKTVVVSTDKDFYQLLQFGTVLYDPVKKAMMTEALFRKEYNLPSSNWVKVKALMGDNGDNIPGVDGVGPKTACKFVSEYKTLKNIHRKIREIPKAKRKKSEQQILETRKTIKLAYKLSGFFYDCPVGKKDLVKNVNADMTEVMSFIKRYRMGSLAGEIGLLM